MNVCTPAAIDLLGRIVAMSTDRDVIDQLEHLQCLGNKIFYAWNDFGCYVAVSIALNDDGTVTETADGYSHTCIDAAAYLTYFANVLDCVEPIV